MVLLKILSGNKTGTEWHYQESRFPIQIGRASTSQLSLEENGVWDKHCEIDLRSPDGFLLNAAPNAFVSVNGNKVEQAVLRSGDLIELGAVKLRFGLGPVEQRNLLTRELLTWIALAAISLLQVMLIYRLIF
jgi:hypothetical protein